MGLNLKNEETHRLAHDLAKLTGESMTAAVTVAVKERLERIRKERDEDTFVAEILAIGRDAKKLMGKGKFPDPNDFLYDEKGLPKRSSIRRH